MEPRVDVKDFGFVLSVMESHCLTPSKQDIKETAKLYMEWVNYFYRQMIANILTCGMMSSPEFTLENHVTELQKLPKYNLEMQVYYLCWALSLGCMWLQILGWTWLKAMAVEIICSDMILTHFGIITTVALVVAEGRTGKEESRFLIWVIVIGDVAVTMKNVQHGEGGIVGK